MKDRDLSDFSDNSGSKNPYIIFQTHTCFIGLDSFVDIYFKGRLIEQIEDGIYNIKRRGSGVSDLSLESLNDLGDPRFVDL